MVMRAERTIVRESCPQYDLLERFANICIDLIKVYVTEDW